MYSKNTFTTATDDSVSLFTETFHVSFVLNFFHDEKNLSTLEQLEKLSHPTQLFIFICSNT